MPMNSVTLRPGVNTQRTLSANEAGVTVSQLIRYRDGLIETYGGWESYVTFTAASTVREMHAWQDAAGGKHLALGETNNLAIITSGSNNDITPATLTSDSSQATFTISSGSAAVRITDPGSSGAPSVYNTVYINTPIAVGNLFLSGPYRIQTVGSTITYTITASGVASTSISSGSGTLATLTTSIATPFVHVVLPNNNYLAISGLFYPFIAPTSVGGLTIVGPYQVSSIIDSTEFVIAASMASSANATATMNSGRFEAKYYITQGAQPSGTGFGAGGYGSGGFGSGSSAIVSVPGTPITATDWTLDNWGEVLLACPEDGPIYTWAQNSGLFTAQVIPEAPFFNGGIFVSMPQQILVAYRSCQITGVQDQLLVKWSDASNYTNWEISNQTSAGDFRIPTGSRIMGAMQGPTQGLLWTDVDVWVMRYIGGTNIFNFNRVGDGCGLVGPHAMASLSGNIYWMGVDNFFTMNNQGVSSMPCTVWDFVFQNINRTYITKVYCGTNSAFNEVAWFFPSTSATENDCYVKYNIVEGEWDYGQMSRTAWVDVSVLGNPIAADPTGDIFQHETGTVTAGTPAAVFASGYWAISDGNDLGFVDFVIPDFKWGTWAGSQNASINVIFYVTDYPGDTAATYGPYTINSTTKFINTRFRGRLVSIFVQGDGSTFWRIGRIRFRFASSGRR